MHLFQWLVATMAIVLKLSEFTNANMPGFVNLGSASDEQVRDMQQAVHDAVKLARVAAATFNPCEEVSAFIRLHQSLG